ncbi:TonB-dependent receptor [Desulfobacterales bacterium HSG2]|nr:TonB-dependent receptor [Desulfobacterales bacterium HSG2]
MRTVALVFIGAMICSGSVSLLAASEDMNNPSAQAEDYSEEQELASFNDLITVMEETTELATKTKINADYVPGMVTVLRGLDLTSMGVRNAWEAMAMVPGLNLSIDNAGFRAIHVRGTSKVRGTGNIKMLINSVPMNDLFNGMAEWLLHLPIEMVERIEFIRGPGSAIHGEFAYLGVINVITRENDNSVYGRFGSFRTYTGGGNFSWESSENDLRINLNVAGHQTDGAGVSTGPDVLHGMDMGNISNAPGSTDEAEKLGTALLKLAYKDFSLMALSFRNRRGEYFGAANALPQDDGDFNNKFLNQAVEMRQFLELTRSLGVEMILGWQKREAAIGDYQLYPPGYLGVYSDGMRAKAYLEEEYFSGGIEVSWKGWDNHLLFLQMSMTDKGVDKAWQETNYHPLTFAPLSSMQRFSGSESIVKSGEDRRRWTVTMQDEFRFIPRLTLTIGLRYDHYNDVGESYTPRFALVYHFTDSHIFKAQYARAFRPPSFVEMYTINNPIVIGNPNISPPTSNNYELGYIFRKDRTVGKATIFYTELEKLIVVGADGIYTNSGKAKLQGIELEFEHGWESLKLRGNLSYTDSKNLDTGNDIAGSVKWLANLGVIWQPISNLALAAQFRYVGDRNREHQDNRDNLDGYKTLDLTGSVFNLGINGMTLRGGIRNLFDEDIRYPAMLTTDFLGNSFPTYSEDYPRPGRQWWIQLSYTF